MSSENEIFGHVRESHSNLARPDKKDTIQTLVILDETERFLLSVDNVLALAYQDKIALDYNEQYARTSVSVKGQGRTDAKEIIGSVKQSVSIPTTMQKVRRIFTGRGGKMKETDREVETEVGFTGGD